MNKKIIIAIFSIGVVGANLTAGLFFKQKDVDKAMALSRKNKKGQTTTKKDRNLVNLRFKGATLYGSNLSGAQMQRSHLEKSTLKDVNLTNANLRLSNLRNSNLSNAILKDTNLSYCNLEGAYLGQAKFWRTNLKGVKWKGANLEGATGLSENDKRNAKNGGAIYVPK